jgi:hypothetical protein
LDFIETNTEMIGGEGKVVEIDESKFGKRKYHRGHFVKGQWGHFVKGQWVFGGVERGTGRTFLVAVRDRSAEPLVGLIKKWILPGTTIIISDCWAAYSSLHEEGYTHFTVNHSIEFVDEMTGSHTNTIESTWKQVKVLLSPYNRKADYVYILAEYMLRQKVLIPSASSWTLLEQHGIHGCRVRLLSFVHVCELLLTTDPSSRIYHLSTYCVCLSFQVTLRFSGFRYNMFASLCFTFLA